MPGRHSGAPFPQRSTRTRTRTTPARTRQPASELPGGPATSAAPVSPHGGPGRLHAYGAAAVPPGPSVARTVRDVRDRKSTRLNSSHVAISYAVFCLKKKKDDTELIDRL